MEDIAFATEYLRCHFYSYFDICYFFIDRKIKVIVWKYFEIFQKIYPKRYVMESFSSQSFMLSPGSFL